MLLKNPKEKEKEIMEISKIKKKDISQDKISSLDNLSLTITTGMAIGIKVSLIKKEKEILQEKGIFTIKVAKMVIKADKEASKEAKMGSKGSLMEMVRIVMLERMTISSNLTISQVITNLKSKASLNNTITDFYKNYFLRLINTLKHINPEMFNPFIFILK